MPDIFKALVEAGVTIKASDIAFLSEDAKIKVADATLTEMFKFVTDKYNALDFSEIERSAGDIRKFKYRELIMSNAVILDDIYKESSDPGAEKYREVIRSVSKVNGWLGGNAGVISELYRGGNGVVQMIYTSTVAAMIYGVSALITNTIRFVTTETDSDMEVVFEEIPGSIRQVHIRNLLNLSNDIESFNKVIQAFSKNDKTIKMNEAVTTSSVAIAIMAIGGVIYLIPKIITLIREIIYSVYYSRVKMQNMLELQISLIRTNIESLEAGRGNKKVIVRQKRIADQLEKLKTKLSVKLDTADALSKVQQKKENQSLHLDRNSPLVSSEAPADGSLMI